MKAIVVIGLICSVAICTSAEYDPLTNQETPNFHQYCVIGAGPGGLQSAYYLEHSQRDYIVYEKGHGAGTFYNKFPIHRMLISINKRHTGKTNKEFNMRHDWNSLLSHDESLEMTKYSKEFFPPADVLVKYLNDYKNKLNIKVQVNTTISNLLKREDQMFQMNDQNGKTYTCQYIIMATGIAQPWSPKFEGMELTDSYSDLSLDTENFEGQQVLILGNGNSAHETAQHIMGSTAFIHMLTRSRVKLAWSTHYVGDLRAVNNGLLDTYQLKSLDGVFEGDVADLVIKRSPLDNRLYIQEGNETSTIPGGNVLDDSENDGAREGYDRIIRCLGFEFDHSIFHPSIKLHATGIGSKKYPKINFIYESTEVKNLFFSGTNTHSLDHKKSAGGFIHGYRYTGRALHHLLEWRNHRVQWPSVHFRNLQDLTPYIHKRVNEAAGLYQMFSVLCDVVIFNKDKTEATYLEAVPCALASKTAAVTGHEVPGSILFVAMEYGKNFSGPAKDVFGNDRVTSEAKFAWRSNFLHPNLYFYEKVFTPAEFVQKPNKWILPVPDKMHAIVEDFTTKFDGADTHIMHTRRFIEMATGKDLRFFYASQCLGLALTSTSLPYGCQRRSNDTSSAPIFLNSQLRKTLSEMSPHLLPFLALKQ